MCFYFFHVFVSVWIISTDLSSSWIFSSAVSLFDSTSKQFLISDGGLMQFVLSLRPGIQLLVFPSLSIQHSLHACTPEGLSLHASAPSPGIAGLFLWHRLFTGKGVFSVLLQPWSDRPVHLSLRGMAFSPQRNVWTLHSNDGGVGLGRECFLPSVTKGQMSSFWGPQAGLLVWCCKANCKNKSER